MTMPAAHLVAPAPCRIRETTALLFGALPPAGVLIDVREPAEFAAGHLAGAVNIPLGLLAVQVEGHPALAPHPAPLHKGQAMVVYCRSGCRSALAAADLLQMGFTDVTTIADGIAGWTAAGLPLATS